VKNGRGFRESVATAIDFYGDLSSQSWVVIQEVFELGIKPNFNFCVESQKSVYKVGE
jgi:hypothetical protein